ncbi:MAG TPA: trigger factor [Planctomycetota bacterium]|nr:trigger factor [Planctomycetota bacterium]
MDAQVEALGSCKRKITVQVPVEDVKKKFEENYENLRKNLELPGFRRGRVPRRLIEKRFGEDVAKDVRQALVDEAYEKVLTDNDLKVIGAPDFGGELPPVSIEQPYSYTVSVEVRPTFEMPDYTAISLKKPSAEPIEEEINGRVDYYRHRMATVQTVDGPAEKDDVLVADLDARSGDESILKREDITVGVRAMQIEGIEVENLADTLTGAKAGDVKTIDVTAPDDFFIEEHRAKPLSLSLTVKEVKRPVLPEANAEWAKEMGFDSLDEFRQEIAKQIRRIKESEGREFLRAQIRDQLAQTVQMDLPEKVTQVVSEDNAKRCRLLLQYQGLSPQEIDDKMKEQAQENEENTKKNLKLYFLFEDVAEQEKIFVTEDELHGRVDQIAANYGTPPEQLWDRMSRDGQIDSLRKEMVDEKIIDFLISKAKVEELPPGAPAQPEQEEGKPPE